MHDSLYHLLTFDVLADACELATTPVTGEQMQKGGSGHEMTRSSFDPWMLPGYALAAMIHALLSGRPCGYSNK